MGWSNAQIQDIINRNQKMHNFSIQEKKNDEIYNNIVTDNWLFELYYIDIQNRTIAMTWISYS